MATDRKILGRIIYELADRIAENGHEDPALSDVLSKEALRSFSDSLDEDGWDALAEEIAAALHDCAYRVEHGLSSPR